MLEHTSRILQRTFRQIRNLMSTNVQADIHLSSYLLGLDSHVQSIHGVHAVSPEMLTFFGIIFKDEMLSNYQPNFLDSEISGLFATFE